jgi:hypothetical protein
MNAFFFELLKRKAATPAIKKLTIKISLISMWKL